MNESTVRAFLERVPNVNYIGTSGDNHLSCKCLFEHKHPKGYDSHPSMTVSYNCAVPWITCFACGLKRPLEDALYALASDGRLDPSVCLDFTQAKAHQVVLYPEINYDAVKDYTVPLSFLRKNAYPKNAEDFLKSKNVSLKVARKFYVSYVPEGHSDFWMGEKPDGTAREVPKEGLALPIIAKDGDKWVCAGAQIRYLSGSMRYSAMYKFSATRRLFGEQLLPNCKGKDIFLTEGPFDALHIITEGFLALAILGTHFNENKAKLFKSADTKCVHILLDADDAGHIATTKTADILKAAGVNYHAHKASKDPKKYTKEDLINLIHNPYELTRQE